MGKRLEDLALVEPKTTSASAVPVTFGNDRERSTDALVTSPAPALPSSVAGLLPVSGFIRAYVEYAFPLTEAAAEAHLAAALATASALLGKNVRLAWADDHLYLNIWATLVGPSTLPRKSTVLRKSEGIVRAIEASLILPDDASGAALIDLLGQCSTRVWYLPEAGLLFAQAEAKFNVGLKQLLANLYDVPPELCSARRGTQRHSQVIRVQRPYLTMLGATTTAWLTAHLTEADLLGGLYGRYLYFPLPDPGPNGRRIPIPPAVDAARYQRVLDQARRLYAFRGTVDPSPIHAQYDRWYRSHGKELYTLHDRDRIGSFWGRLETSMLKLAALHQLGLLAAHQDSNAASEDAVIVISPEALDLAIALVEHLKRGLVVLFRQELATSRIAEAKQKMLAVVRQAGGSISQRELQRRSTNLLTKDFHSVLGTLVEEGSLTQEPIKTEKGQPSVLVRLSGDDATGACPNCEGVTDA